MDTFLQLLISGLMLGGVYAIIALGFVVIFKSSGIFNFAQGQLLMIGGYLCWSFLSQFHLPTWASFLAVLLVAVAIGLIIERFALRPMIGQPLLAAIMITIALASVLDGIVTIVWGGDQLILPEFISRASLDLGSISISRQSLWLFLISLALFGCFVLFFRFTKMGLAMRGTAEDQQVVQAAGIRVSSIFALSWVIASIVSVIGGIFLGSLTGVSPTLAFLGLKAFPVVILGGLESIPGALIAGLLVGSLEKIAGGYIDPLIGGGFEEIFPFIILLVVLLIKPFGLFGLKRIERV